MSKPNPNPKKVRLDQLLVDRGLVATRTRAQSLILAGKVLVEDNPDVKAGQKISELAQIRVKEDDHPYVSRAGIKLKAALEAFRIRVSGRISLDIGASTGGFCQVLLEEGTTRVFAVDVGQNQMDWKIRQDSRVVVMEKTNARHLKFDQIGTQVGVITMDVSFISIEKILPALIPFAAQDTDWITLIKPQFEVGKDKVGKGGIVHSERDRLATIERIHSFGETLGLNRLGLIESPIAGMDGNQEYLAHWKLSPKE